MCMVIHEDLKFPEKNKLGVSSNSKIILVEVPDI